MNVINEGDMNNIDVENASYEGDSPSNWSPSVRRAHMIAPTYEIKDSWEDRGLVMPVIEAILVSVLFMVGIAANLLVFAVFYHKPILLTTSNKLLVHLSIVQCLLLLLVIPLWTASIFHLSWRDLPHVCDITATASSVLLFTAIYNMVLVALDRCFAIVKPLHYKRMITARRMATCLLVIWFLAFAVSLCPLFGWGRFAYHSHQGVCTVDWSAQLTPHRVYAWFVICVFFVVPLSVVAVAYGVIYNAARKSVSRTKRRSLTPSDLTSETLTANGSMPIALRRSSSASVTQFLFRRRSSCGARSVTSLARDDLLAAKTVIVAMVSFIACWLPFYIVNVLEVIRGSGQVPYWAHFVAVYLVASACFINPIVYVFRSKVVKETLCVTGYFELLCKRCPCNSERADCVTGDPTLPPAMRIGRLSFEQASLQCQTGTTGTTALNQQHTACSIVTGQATNTLNRATV